MGDEKRCPRIRLLAAAAVSVGCSCGRGSLAVVAAFALLGALSGLETLGVEAII